MSTIFHLKYKNKSERGNCHSIQQKHPRSSVFVNLIPTEAWKTGIFHILRDEKYDHHHITSCQVCVLTLNFLIKLILCSQSTDVKVFCLLTTACWIWLQDDQTSSVVAWISNTESHQHNWQLLFLKSCLRDHLSLTQFTKSYRVSFIKSLKILLLQINGLTQVKSRRDNRGDKWSLSFPWYFLWNW